MTVGQTVWWCLREQNCSSELFGISPLKRRYEQEKILTLHLHNINKMEYGSGFIDCDVASAFSRSWLAVFIECFFIRCCYWWRSRCLRLFWVVHSLKLFSRDITSLCLLSEFYCASNNKCWWRYNELNVIIVFLKIVGKWNITATQAGWHLLTWQCLPSFFILHRLSWLYLVRCIHAIWKIYIHTVSLSTILSLHDMNSKLFIFLHWTAFHYVVYIAKRLNQI